MIVATAKDTAHSALSDQVAEMHERRPAIQCVANRFRRSGDQSLLIVVLAPAGFVRAALENAWQHR
jgi:hypothetical protein